MIFSKNYVKLSIFRRSYIQSFVVLNTLCYNECMIKKCKIHGQVNHFLRKDGSWRCGKCASRWVIDSRIKKKTELVKIFGGKCKICGYNQYIGSLDFHHVNPATKKFALSVKGLCYAWKDILREAKKCVLLCKNCHTEIENGVIKLKT